ncbi:MAG: hypothetical protein DI536_28320 [Archangium gephyra]|uniref:Lipoprotein n=1 Tax=Archangium gephyra TaxID=48 RepID=A0A2W5SZH2_9BACT|nr:MAG: hypothetical protein DI536_28320 [Archangium gephyra]
MRFTAVMLSLFVLSGCRCGRVTEGTCDGAWGTATVKGAELDKSSRVVIERKKTCEDLDVVRYELSWGNGAFATRFSLKGGAPTVLAAKDYRLPSSEFMSFDTTPEKSPEGTVTLGLRGMEGDRTGKLVLKNGGQEMSCSFAVSYETEGTLLSCDPADGGDGG